MYGYIEGVPVALETIDWWTAPFSHYGTGLFETLRLSDGVPEALEAHYQRLKVSACALKLPAVPPYEFVLEASLAAAERDGVTRGKMKWRYLPLAKSMVFLIETAPYPYVAQQYEKGFRVLVSTTVKPSSSILSRVKSTNYTAALLEKKAAGDKGFDEVLFFNERGELAEGAVSNIFFRVGRRLLTPTQACGILAGTMRAKVMAEWASLGGEVVEGRFDCATFEAAESVFLTNALMGVMPVSAVGDKVYPVASDAQAAALMQRCNIIF